jgi:hypothetical protein
MLVAAMNVRENECYLIPMDEEWFRQVRIGGGFCC